MSTRQSVTNYGGRGAANSVTAPVQVWPKEVWGPLEYLVANNRRPAGRLARPMVLTGIYLSLSAAATVPTKVEVLAGEVIIATIYISALWREAAAAEVHADWRTIPENTVISCRVNAAAETYANYARGLEISLMGRWVE